MKIYRCKVCFYLHEGEFPPPICPKCGAPKEQFEAMPNDGVELLTRAKKTNKLLTMSLTHLEELKELAKEGINDNLDPGCLNLFQKIDECTSVLRNIIIAELKTHFSKNKLG